MFPLKVPLVAKRVRALNNYKIKYKFETFDLHALYLKQCFYYNRISVKKHTPNNKHHDPVTYLPIIKRFLF